MNTRTDNKETITIYLMLNQFSTNNGWDNIKSIETAELTEDYLSTAATLGIISKVFINKFVVDNYKPALKKLIENLRVLPNCEIVLNKKMNL